MEQSATEFVPLLEGFDRGHLRDNPASVFGFWPDLTLAYVNDAWFGFAAANGGEPGISTSWGIGARLTDAISPPLDGYYARRLKLCLSEGNPWSHEYECSSPDQFRKFHMIVYPLKDGRGGLVVNSLVIDEPHNPKRRREHAAKLERYADEDGSLHQCMHCRRTRRNTVHDQWDWVPVWVAQSPPNTSHGLCQTCLDFHYPELEDEEAAIA